ncbi:MAG: RNA methyltransferase [Bacteroidetes bacterium]|nr:RNA methyltransferase [Bacteroidota bacterium]
MSSTKLTKNIAQLLRSLSLKKYREEQNLFIVEGWNSISEIMNSKIEIEILVSTENQNQDILKKAKQLTKSYFYATENEINKISNTKTSQGILAAVKPIDKSADFIFNQSKKNKIIVALDSISDPGNLGSIIRTCDWYGIDALFISKNSVELYNPKVVQATMGSLFHLLISCNIDLNNKIDEAKKNGFTIIGTDVHGKNILSKELFNPQKKYLIVFGNEAHGIDKSLKNKIDKYITIPKFGKAESLNISVSVGVILSSLKINE